MTNISKKYLTSKKQKRSFYRSVYSRYKSEILVRGWYMIVLIYKWYDKVMKITKIECYGIQTGICRNLVHECYMNKKS